ncbi:MAG TPA: DUF1810 family protein [Candidatus Eisenbacteria bacterium]|nr:DUF1810 family protein [Candidatus Eisenbacteria bacterium]
MADMEEDPHGLGRFLRAQAADYERALEEIRGGRKRSHWMWYVFPQLDGLGVSPTARRYAIRSLAEAEAYLRHPVLGPRLVEIAEAAARVEGRSATEVFGSPDDMKLRSCATLFARVSPPGSVFERLLARYFQSRPDDRTLDLLRRGETMPFDLDEFAKRYTAAWCSQKPESVAAFFAENGSLAVNDAPPAVGRAAITEVARGFMTAFPDMVVLLDRLVRGPEAVEYHWTLVGTNSGPGGTGKKVRISGYEAWRIDAQGLVAESQGHFDAAEYQRQLEQGV